MGLHDMLLTELKKSEGLKMDLAPYRKKPKKEQVYSELLDLFKRWLQEKKDEANIEKELRRPERRKHGTSVPAKGKYGGATCYLCGKVGHIQSECRSAAAKGKGKGKGKNKGDKRGKGGDASYPSGTTAASLAGGKAKGKAKSGPKGK